MDTVDSRIGEWRTAILKNRAVTEPDADELEGHLREQVAELQATGLTGDEAFLIGVRRLGEINSITAEYAREHSDRLWKQLALPEANTEGRLSLRIMLVFAALGALLVQPLRILAQDQIIDFGTLALNLSIVVLGVLTAYLTVVRRAPWRRILAPLGVIGALAAAVNFFPMDPTGPTEVVVIIHLPVVLWFIVGYAYLGGDFRAPAKRMDFVRFSGEWLIYYTLIALGGSVLMTLTSLVLIPFGPEVGTAVYFWILPSGMVAAVIVAAWLVEAKKSVIENLAPVLTAIFTPLFAIMLVVAAFAYAIAGVWQNFDRELLIGFDLLLLVVIALVVYGISAREPNRGRGVMDVIRLFAVAAAILLDVLILVSLFSRISEYGFTPNRVAVLGLNLILLVNLVVTVWYLARLVTGTAPAERLERWQTRYLPVLAAWALTMVLVLPPVFGFM